MVEKQKYGWKPKEKTAAKGSGKMVLYYVTIIPFNVFYMSKAMWLSSLFIGNPKEHRCSKIYSQEGGDESTQQKKAIYSYFSHWSPIYKGTYLYTNV